MYKRQINNLEDVHVLDDYIVKLGKRHSRILGIKTVGFEVMGMAFMTTLQDRFGSFFTLELKNLWGQLYSYLANCMIKAGKDPMGKTKFLSLIHIFTGKRIFTFGKG